MDPYKNKKLAVYIEWNSQPSRAVLAFCKLNKIPIEIKEVRLGKQ